MKGDQTILHVGARAHLRRAAQQNAHLTGAHLGKELFLFHLGVGIVDKSDLPGWNTAGNQLLSDVLIHAEAALNSHAGVFACAQNVICIQRRHVIAKARISVICGFRGLFLRFFLF